MSNPTCEDRVAGHLASRIRDLEQMQEALGEDGGVIEGEEVTSDEVLDMIEDYALAVDLRSTLIVTISTGGPGDQLEIEVINDGHGWELADTSAIYRFLDWGDGATRRTNDDAVMDYLQSMVGRLPF